MQNISVSNLLYGALKKLITLMYNMWNYTWWQRWYGKMAKHCRNLKKTHKHMSAAYVQAAAANFRIQLHSSKANDRTPLWSVQASRTTPLREAEKRPSGTHTKKLFRLLKLSEVSSQLLKHPLRGLMSFVEHWHHRARILVLGKALEKTKFKNPFAPFFSILKISRCLGAVRTKLKQKS